MPKKTKLNNPEQPQLVTNAPNTPPPPKGVRTSFGENARTSFDGILDGTEAGRIWNDIKDREIFMFALPNQIVSQHAKPVLIDPGVLHLVLMSSAALPSLEEAVGKSDSRRGIMGYQVELADRFVVVKPAPLSLVDKMKK